MWKVGRYVLGNVSMVIESSEHAWFPRSPASAPAVIVRGVPKRKTELGVEGCVRFLQLQRCFINLA